MTENTTEGSMPPDPREPLSAELHRLRSLTSIKWSMHEPDVLAAWVADMDLPPAPPWQAPCAHSPSAGTSATTSTPRAGCPKRLPSGRSAVTAGGPTPSGSGCSAT
jgi:hypothetical protein